MLGAQDGGIGAFFRFGMSTQLLCEITQRAKWGLRTSPYPPSPQIVASLSHDRCGVVSMANAGNPRSSLWGSPKVLCGASCVPGRLHGDCAQVAAIYGLRASDAGLGWFQV